MKNQSIKKKRDENNSNVCTALYASLDWDIKKIGINSDLDSDVLY